MALQTQKDWAVDDDSLAAVLWTNHQRECRDEQGKQADSKSDKDEATSPQTLDMKPAAVDTNAVNSVVTVMDDEDFALLEAQMETDEAMENSVIGLAWKFVTRLLEEHKSNLSPAAGCAVIGIDDLMYTVERFLETRDIFQMQGKDTRVDLGYHFTKSENLKYIQMNGLMTRSDRRAKGVDRNFNGDSFGDGVYTGNNIHSCQYYGDVGLIVARLRGDQKPAVRRGIGFIGDTAVAHIGQQNEMVILQQSSQCIPLVHFRRSTSNTNQASFWECHKKLQYICDQIFHDGMVSSIDCPLAVVQIPRASKAIKAQSQFSSHIPWIKKGILFADGQDIYSLKRKEVSSLTTQIIHRCDTVKFRGLFETMRIMTFPHETLSLGGSDGIVLVYAFHPSDCGHTCSHHITYLPDTSQGWKLLRRLKHAFWEGLIGTVTWSLIPHVTNPYLHLPTYFFCNANDALNKMGIPQSEDCEFYFTN
jgi:hypothetical protein